MSDLIVKSFVSNFLEDLKLSLNQDKIMEEWISDVISTLDVELIEALFKYVEVEALTPATIIIIANMTKPCKNVLNERNSFIIRSNNFLAKINWPYKIK